MSKKDSSLAPVMPSAMMIRLSPLAGWVMLAFMLSGLGFNLWAMLVSGKVQLLPETPSWADVRSGEVTHRIARELTAVPFAKRAADLERAASWLAIGDLGPRVRQGCPGWLFLADELQVHTQAQHNAQARADKVRALNGWLAGRGIELLVVLVPDKSRIAAEQLCGLPRSPALAPRVAQWQGSLQQAGIATLDLTATLQPLGSAAYLRTDTHWSETGAAAAAQRVAKAVAGLAVTPSPLKQWSRSVGAEQVRPGDLVRLAGIDWLPIALQPAVERVAASQFSALDEAAGVEAEDLFGDSQLPNVALIGTSFSRNSNFVGFLEQALGTSLGNFAKDGGGFDGAAKDYLQSPAFEQTPPRLLIWEIPERDLQTPFEDWSSPDQPGAH
ncbi:Cell division protein FtsQ [Pseudomonas sp. 8Z]|uniref:alginate O-acetyltransferase AlgX-related protein n=1 Tax=Pseudomonas sp. 8Z TaxID=2653166 RepID=UPI0012F3E735|nr:cell division protein FtsQ [Pseudomonas sp. 8Z]VXC43598.1 Cell division protein FtsQ [Pseudomonas sp. 8Z]